MITWTKRLLLTLTFLTLIATNVLTLTSTVFNAALSGLLSTTMGVHTVYAKRKAATKRFGTKLVKRTKRVAKRSMIPAPLMGHLWHSAGRPIYWAKAAIA